MPFLATGEQAAVDMEDLEQPLRAIIRVPLSESDLRHKVEKRLGYEKDDLNPGTFHRLLKELQITCHKDLHSG